MPRRALEYVCTTCRHRTNLPSLSTRPPPRRLHIRATPASSELPDAPNEGGSTGPPTDARFEVLGASSALLAARVSASQHLYTRKGTLVGFQGAPENAVSTLSLLEPFRRAVAGIPFLYQRVSSTTPYTALIGTRSPLTALAVVHLDGRRDWMVAQRNALLAWTGDSLALTPRLHMSMSLAHWGNTVVSGRGLVALAGRGLVHQVTLQPGEEYTVHPAHVMAYSITSSAPQPYRFKSGRWTLQPPNPLTWLPDAKFWHTMRQTATWRHASRLAFTLRTWARRTIWGDRLFLHFRGPATLLVQSRGARLGDILSTRDVNELADSPAGSVSRALVSPPTPRVSSAADAPPSTPSAPKLSYASVARGGSVKFEEQRS